MNHPDYERQAIFEHQFWLQVLGDHARFIFNTLSSQERRAVKEARRFIRTFDQLLAQSRQPLAVSQLDELTRMAYEESRDIRAFKLDLIKQHLVGDIELGLPPTFINHMVNEVEEYLEILKCLLEKQTVPVYHPVHHHLLWLLDAMGHAAALSGDLDVVEFRLREVSDTFVEHFKDYYIKAVEMKGYLRTSLERFPALARFNFQVEQEILCFKEFLCNLREMVRTNEALGAIAPLIPDHMLREECYYLIKLSQVSEVKPPECDPTRARVE